MICQLCSFEKCNTCRTIALCGKRFSIGHVYLVKWWERMARWLIVLPATDLGVFISSIPGLPVFSAGIAIEKRTADHDKWCRAKISLNKKRKYRKDTVFRCFAISTKPIPLYQFAFFCTLNTPFYAKAWNSWRNYCRKKCLDVDHAKQKWWCVLRR